jgi:hypothetical protein
MHTTVIQSSPEESIPLVDMNLFEKVPIIFIKEPSSVVLYIGLNWLMIMNCYR